MALRASFAFVVVACFFHVACGSSGSSGVVACGDAGCVSPDGGAGPLVEGGVATDGGSPTDAGTCLTEVPCASDTQCVSMPGTTCNGALHRCQTVFCLPEGQPCSNGGQCQGEICERKDGLDDGLCTSRESEIATCAIACAAKVKGATFCAGHPLKNIAAACTEMCAPFLDDKSCSARVMQDAICHDDGRCSLMDGCGHDYTSTSSCD